MTDNKLFCNHISYSTKKLLANNNPSKFGWLVRFYDEFYLLLNGSIQLHYIHAYGTQNTDKFIRFLNIIF